MNRLEPADLSPCPLCEGRDADPKMRVDYRSIWRSLEERWNAHYTDQFKSDYQRGAETALLSRCRECGLEYFSPARPGDAHFYEVLASNPDYFVEERWEFDHVLGSLRGSDALIDFGTGRGAFLLRAKHRVSRALGCDHLEGGGSSTVSGVPITHDPFEDVAAAHAGQFDVATAFHVLEHVPEARVVCGPAHVALKPGGRLFLSTPDAERTLRDDFEVLDCPPHHLSRWGDDQFVALGERHGFELVEIRHEPYVHAGGRRRWVPPALLFAAGLAVHRARGYKIQPPGDLRIGVNEKSWPRGLAVLAEYRRSA